MEVSTSLDILTRLVHDARPLWKEAGNLETSLLGHRLQHVELTQPVYITGLARAGSTLILEFLAAQKGVVTHQYRDFPFIFTPYFSRKLTQLLSSPRVTKKERAHGDGILVSPTSPESMEEMLWQAFRAHDSSFIEFYHAHIRKLLLAAGGSRYVAKNNNLALRIPALLAAMPDARIIVPVRDPAAHIGSLMRQHEKFCAEANTSRAKRHLKAQQHFEFGPTRNWQVDNELEGWIQQWNTTYRALTHYRDHPQFLFVQFEKLCEAPRYWLYKIGAHANIAIDEDKQEVFARSISLPSYYTPSLTEEEIGHIRVLTAEVNGYFTGNVIA